MPRKIGFAVISCTGHEDNYSAKELMVHAPTVNGWRSTRLCHYPQEVTLQMTECCRIRKLQLLAHQYMISAKIEFHIRDRLPESALPSCSEQFRRLGYVSLSDNEKTGFRARELKSVHVDAVGMYLKLTFHRNHVNRFNLYNQVALVAINILGDPVDGNDISTIPTRDQLIELYLSSSQHDSALDGSYNGKYESISPLDDLAFDMYQDPEVAQIIRVLDEKKQDMVRLERYDLAKKLKQAIADLQKVGERLGRYDVEKRGAIEKEDYDTAKQKKEQMEAYRLKVYQQLELHNLLDMDQIQRMAELSSEDVELRSPSLPLRKHAAFPPDTSETMKQEQPLESEQVPPKPASPQQTHTSAPQVPTQIPRIDVSPCMQVTGLPYDERPLLTLRKKDRQGEQPQVLPEETPPPLDSVSSSCSPRVVGEPEPLTEKAQREASFPIEVYGDSLVAGAYSKTWSYREDALLAVYKKLSEVPPGTPKSELRNMMRAAVFLTRKALADKVSPVFQASLKLLRMILTQFIPKHHLGKVEVTHCVEQTWPLLISRTGDSTSRLRAVAVAFIQDMALFKEVRSLQAVPAELVKPVKSSMPTRLALSRMELLERLLETLGTETSGFTLDNVMRFLTGALEHSASAVRELAVRIVQSMYRLHRNAVLHYLPPNDANTRKNVLYKNIYNGFAKIDGRPTESQTSKKGGTQEEVEKEKEEIRSLQEQLAALKEISEKGREMAKGPENKAEKNVKTGVTKLTKPNPSDAEDNQSSVANYLDNLCIFCGEKDESFTEDGLDLHYWKHCPMLRRCVQCRQVVEIASLTEHLLTECENKPVFTQCPHCTEAVIREELTEHAQSPACNPPVSGKVNNHCPLCHENFMPGEEVWKSHLMGSEGCKQNSRRTAVFQRAQLSQGKTIGTGVSKAAPSVSRGRSLGRGSRIPAPAAKVNRTVRHVPGKR